jgi:hypothetical protein
MQVHEQLERKARDGKGAARQCRPKDPPPRAWSTAPLTGYRVMKHIVLGTEASL